MLPPPVRTRKFAADRAYVDAAATGLGVDRAPDVIEMNAAAAGFTLDPPADAGGSEVAAVSFHFHQINIARNIDHKFAGGAAGPAAFPFAHHPGRVSTDVNADLVGFEFAAGFFFRRSVRVIADDVVDGLLRAAHNFHHARIHLHPQVFRRRPGSR